MLYKFMKVFLKNRCCIIGINQRYIFRAKNGEVNACRAVVEII